MTLLCSKSDLVDHGNPVSPNIIHVAERLFETRLDPRTVDHASLTHRATVIGTPEHGCIITRALLDKPSVNEWLHDLKASYRSSQFQVGDLREAGGYVGFEYISRKV